MKPRTAKRLTIALGAVTAALLTACVCAQEPPVPKSIDDEIAELRLKVLADTRDVAAVRTLVQLRLRQKDERDKALDALRKGLEAYLAKDLLRAGVELAKAARSRNVVHLADTFLLKTLDEIIAECPQTRTQKRKPGAKPCWVCGDTLRANCRKCYGSGTIRCPKCRGKGYTKTRTVVLPQRRRRLVYPVGRCLKCGGSGAVACPTCARSGTVTCYLCSKKAARGSDKPGPNAVEAIRKVICMSRYLRRGGIDLYSPDALKPSTDVLRKP